MGLNRDQEKSSRVPGSKASMLALGLLILFIFAWDLRAIVLDQEQDPANDTTIRHAMQLDLGLRNLGLMEMAGQGFRVDNPKGPLSGLLVLALSQQMDDMVLAGRLLSILLNALVLWLVFLLARWILCPPPAALLCTLICATFPLQYGYYRLPYQEPLLTVFVLLVLGLMLRGITRWRHALGLGIAGGLGLLTKLAFPIYVMGGGLYWLWRRARSPGDMLRISLAVAVAGVVAAAWVLSSLEIIRENLSLASRESFDVELILDYLSFPPFSILLFGSVVSGAALLWLRPDIRQPVALLTCTTLAAALLLILKFQTWFRYLVPLIPVMSILGGLGLWELGQRLASSARLGRRGRFICGGVLAAALLVQFCYSNLVGIEHGDDQRYARYFTLGMIAPRQQPHRALRDARAFLLARGVRLFSFKGGHETYYLLAQRRGPVIPALECEQARQRREQRLPLHVLVHGLIKQDPRRLVRGGIPDRCQPMRPFPEQQVQLIKRFEDPNGNYYAIMALSAR